jgi:hypothetical protein
MYTIIQRNAWGLGLGRHGARLLGVVDAQHLGPLDVVEAALAVRERAVEQAVDLRKR